ncbi:thioredoxin-like domain-containing protein [Schizothecium vesticola]|uniref:Thioredoxin-like domain-containing protein n=1 Tax=Schizothecium vesticola TaxID=314040 RepID=A0AA40BPV1_9PEZI|nr:thioredoxin-like domain-containing protein [Schizothecium vesticola]
MTRLHPIMCHLFFILLQSLRLVLAWDHLPEETFRDTVAQGDTVLVAFVAPDEPKSAALETEWLAAAAESKDRLISINCGDPDSSCDHEGVEPLPMIVLFNKGDAIAHYRGPARAAAILGFVARQKRPIVSTVRAEDLVAFKMADETVLVAYLDPDDHAPAEAFADVAMQYRDEFTFGIVTDPTALLTQKIVAPAVMCYKVIDGDTSKFAPFDDLSRLDEWVKEATRPVISELTVLNQKRLLERGWPMVYLFAKKESERQQLRKTLYRFARSYYDSLTSVLVDPLEFPDLMPSLGLDPSILPAGAVHQLSKDRIYHYPRDKLLNPSTLQQWGLDVYQGRIKPWTPPGVTTSYDDLGPTRAANARVSIPTIPGVTIRIAGHDEL